MGPEVTVTISISLTTSLRERRRPQTLTAPKTMLAFRGALRLCPARARLARALSAAGGGDVSSSGSFFKQASANSTLCLEEATTTTASMRYADVHACTGHPTGESSHPPRLSPRVGDAVSDAPEPRADGGGHGAHPAAERPSVHGACSEATCAGAKS